MVGVLIMMLSISPVSYTHLDVYKRQVSGGTDIEELAEALDIELPEDPDYDTVRCV